MDIHLAFSNMGCKHQHNPSYNNTMDPDMALCGNMDPDIIMTLGGRTRRLLVWKIPVCSIVQEHQHGFKLQHRKRISALPLVRAWTMDFNTDPAVVDHERSHGPQWQHWAGHQHGP